jgi:hypothetical protein
MYSRNNKLRLKRQEANMQGDPSWHLIIIKTHQPPGFDFSDELESSPSRPHHDSELSSFRSAKSWLRSEPYSRSTLRLKKRPVAAVELLEFDSATPGLKFKSETRPLPVHSLSGRACPRATRSIMKAGAKFYALGQSDEMSTV